MSKFDYLKNKGVKEDVSIPYTIYEISSEPTLMVLPATEANRQYQQAFLKSFGRRVKMKVDAAAVKRNRDVDRKLYAKFVITGWEKVEDTGGNAVPYTKEDCAEFLQALPNYIFDDLRGFCSDPENFLQDDEELVEPLEGEDVKNSASG